MIELMTVAGIALKTSLVVVAAGLLSVALRRQSAAFHHALWTSALALCVLMPLAVLFLPSHDVVVLPAAQTKIVRSAAPSGSVVVALLLIGSAIVLMRELLATIGLARWRRQAQGASDALVSDAGAHRRSSGLRPSRPARGRIGTHRESLHVGRAAADIAVTDCRQRLARVRTIRGARARARTYSTTRRSQHSHLETRVRAALVQPARVARSRACPQLARAGLRRRGPAHRRGAFRLRSVPAGRRRRPERDASSCTHGTRHGAWVVAARTHRRHPRSAGDALAAAAYSSHRCVRIARRGHDSSRNDQCGSRAATVAEDTAVAGNTGAAESLSPVSPVRAVPAVPAVPATPPVAPQLPVHPRQP